MVKEDNLKEHASQPYKDEQPTYVSSEMLGSFCSSDANVLYYCYFIELKQDFEYNALFIILYLAWEVSLKVILQTFILTYKFGEGKFQ